jgi:hypothetical protein
LLSAKTIPAGGSGQIEAKINTSSLAGPVEKMITITSNDPHNANVNLIIKAVIEPEIGISESQIVFDNTPAEKAVTKEIILTVPEGKSIEVLSAASKNPDIKAKVSPVPGTNGKKWKLIATHRANAIPGYFFGQIVVKTDSQLSPELSVYVRGTTVAVPK